MVSSERWHTHPLMVYSRSIRLSPFLRLIIVYHDPGSLSIGFLKFFEKILGGWSGVTQSSMRLRPIWGWGSSQPHLPCGRPWAEPRAHGCLLWGKCTLCVRGSRRNGSWWSSSSWVVSFLTAPISLHHYCTTEPGLCQQFWEIFLDFFRSVFRSEIFWTTETAQKRAGSYRGRRANKNKPFRLTFYI